MIIFCGFRGQEDDATFLLIPRLSPFLHGVQYNPVITVMKGSAYLDRYWRAPLLVGDHLLRVSKRNIKSLQIFQFFKFSFFKRSLVSLSVFIILEYKME